MSIMALFRSLALIVIFILGGMLCGGCVHSAGHVTRHGPIVPAMVDVQPWTYGGAAARRVVTRHYLIYSTVMNDPFLQALGQTMEGALAEYRLLAPNVPESDHPMECYLFADRPQWAEFTRQKTGPDSVIYLQINRGGYTVHDWYVSYFLGDVGTYSVASHEGFHQFTARHFRKRIPPFLEEGIACLFEDVAWDASLPRWDLTVNHGRQTALRHALEGGMVMSLEQLATLHAGQMIRKSSEEVAGYYAQCWAFARFCSEYEHGKYAAGLKQMLSDAADGTLDGASATRPAAGAFWNPKSAGPLLEHYLGTDLKTLDREYQGYLRELGRE